MNPREITRKLAQQSEGTAWIGSVVMCILFYLVYRDRFVGEMQYLFLGGVALLWALYYQTIALAKEIVRLEEKIEELERRIP